MLELDYGAEIQTLTGRGWTFAGFGEVYQGFGIQHLVAGKGGRFALKLGDGTTVMVGTATSPALAQPLAESLTRVVIKGDATSAGWVIRLKLGATTIAHLTRNGFDQVEIYVDAALQDTSTETLSNGTWYVLTIRYRMLVVGGLFEVFLGGDHVTPIATFEGDTNPGVLNAIDTLEIDGYSDTIDDVVMYSITILYDGGTGGVPIVGETASGAGATGAISAVDGDATSGRLYLHSVTGTFVDDEALTTGGTFVAVVNSPPAATNTPGLEVNSKLPSPHGVLRVMVPAGNGTYSEMQGSDGNQIDNYVHVDDWSLTAANEADFVESGTDGARDFYPLEAPGSFTGVNSVSAMAWATRVGAVVNSMELAVRVNGTDYYGEDKAVGLTYALQEDRFDLNPDTGALWTVNELAGAEGGFRVNA